MVRPVINPRKKDSRNRLHQASIAYFRQKYPSFMPVTAAEELEYVVERILDKRMVGSRTEYLIKWSGYNS